MIPFIIQNYDVFVQYDQKNILGDIESEHIYDSTSINLCTRIYLDSNKFTMPRVRKNANFRQLVEFDKGQIAGL